MRKTAFSILVLFCAAILTTVSCKPDDTKTTDTPEITIAQEEFGVSYEGGDFTTTFSIKNPVEGGTVNPECLADWVTDVKCEGDVLSFSVAPNETDIERDTRITLTYLYGENEVNKSVYILQAEVGGDAPDVTDQPRLENLTGNSIAISPGGGQYVIEYNVLHPAQGGTVEATTDASAWIFALNSETVGQVSFVAHPNNSAYRTGTITVTYKYGDNQSTSFTVSLSQQSTESTITEGGFTITVSDITYSTAKIKIVPEDLSMTYLPFVVEAGRISGMTDEEIFAEDIDILESTAAMFSLTLQQYLSNYRLLRGEIENTQTALQSSTTYTAYVYGLENGNPPTRTTSIVKTDFTTEGMSTPTDEIIELSVELNSNNATIVAVPYTNDRWYAVNWNNEKVLNDAGYTSGSIEDRVSSYEIEQFIKLYLSYGFYGISDLAFQGPHNQTFSYKSGEVYYVYAFFVTEVGDLDSDVWVKTINEDGTITPNNSSTASTGMSFLRK